MPEGAIVCVVTSGRAWQPAAMRSTTSRHDHAARPRRVALGPVVAVAIALALLGGCASGADTATSPTSTTSTRPTATSAAETTRPGGSTEVVKDILGTDVDPPGADGRTLTLIRYTIPPGAKLAPHIHPGVQMARITSGELTYTVVEGTAVVRRKGAAADESIKAPATTTLVAGDTVTEVDGMVHFGANETTEPVIIDATLLTVDGEDLAVPVTTTTP